LTNNRSRKSAFNSLWTRRQRFSIPGMGSINVLALADLVQAKKTQRDKDWPMIRRLVEVDFHKRRKRPTPERIGFWLLEARTAELLIELCREFPGPARRLTPKRFVLKWTRQGKEKIVESALRIEQEALRLADREYWQPLRAELFQWRQERRTRD